MTDPTAEPLPWAEAWQRALYADDGFYRRAEGPAAHFATSAQGIPGVAEVLAQAILALADRHDAGVIVDFACGRGELLGVLRRFDTTRRLVGVDVVERPEGLEPSIGWVRSPGGRVVPHLPLEGRTALVVAHEWLDVVPQPVAEVAGDGTLRETLVTVQGLETSGGRLSAADEEWAATWWPSPAPGERVEIGRPRDEAWSDLVGEVARSAGTGSVVLGIDYGHKATARPPFGSLTGFRDGAECLPRPDGSCDITTHVAVDSLDTDKVSTQREILLSLFTDTPLQPVPIGLARSAPAEYLARLAARSAFAAAVDRSGLGAFQWFTRTIT